MLVGPLNDFFFLFFFYILAQDQGASSSGNLSDGAKIIDTFAHYTRLVHSSCNVLYQQIKAQSEFFIPNEVCC